VKTFLDTNKEPCEMTYVKKRLNEFAGIEAADTRYDDKVTETKVLCEGASSATAEDGMVGTGVPDEGVSFATHKADWADKVIANVKKKKKTKQELTHKADWADKVIANVKKKKKGTPLVFKKKKCPSPPQKGRVPTTAGRSKKKECPSPPQKGRVPTTAGRSKKKECPSQPQKRRIPMTAGRSKNGEREDSRIHPSRRRRPEDELTRKTKKVDVEMGKNGNTIDWFKCYPDRLAVVKRETTGSAAQEKEANLHERQDKDKVSIPHRVHKPLMDRRSVLDVNRLVHVGRGEGTPLVHVGRQQICAVGGTPLVHRQ